MKRTWRVARIKETARYKKEKKIHERCRVALVAFASGILELRDQNAALNKLLQSKKTNPRAWKKPTERLVKTGKKIVEAMYGWATAVVDWDAFERRRP